MENREPDYINNNGIKCWYKHGELHNDFGPAIIWADGTKVWYKHGKLHNENGPARISSSGEKEWYIDSIYCTEEEFKQYKIKNFIDN